MLKEEVATKQRELKKLRQEKHDIKAQYEATINNLVRYSTLLWHAYVCLMLCWPRMAVFVDG